MLRALSRFVSPPPRSFLLCGRFGRCWRRFGAGVRRSAVQAIGAFGGGPCWSKLSDTHPDVAVALDRGDALGGVRGIYLPEHRGARRYFHVWVPASAQPLRGALCSLRMGHRRLTVVDLIAILGLIGYRAGQAPAAARSAQPVLRIDLRAGLLRRGDHLRGGPRRASDPGRRLRARGCWCRSFPVDRMDRRPNRAR